jgi:hypothetical protein
MVIDSLEIKTRNRLGKDIIGRLDIPAVLRELLIGHGFKVEQLLNMSSGDVAEALNIDVDTVRVIGKAIRKQLDDESHFSM